jgi:hypothetical protein
MVNNKGPGLGSLLGSLALVLPVDYSNLKGIEGCFSVLDGRGSGLLRSRSLGDSIASLRSRVPVAQDLDLFMVLAGTGFPLPVSLLDGFMPLAVKGSFGPTGPISNLPHGFMSLGVKG